jgi:hypothetical protein
VPLRSGPVRPTSTAPSTPTGAPPPAHPVNQATGHGSYRSAAARPAASPGRSRTSPRRRRGGGGPGGGCGSRRGKWARRTVARWAETCRLRPRAGLLVLVSLQTRFLRSLPRIVKSISRRGRDPNALVTELAVDAVARMVAWDRSPGAGADALNICHEAPVVRCWWRRTTIRTGLARGYRAGAGPPPITCGESPAPSSNTHEGLAERPGGGQEAPRCRRRKWRRGESNPGPKDLLRLALRACPGEFT